MLELVGVAFLMGMVGSLHCLVMCGPFALMCGGKPLHLAGWHLGKLATYILLGSVAGAVGAIVPGPTWLAPAVSAVLMVWFVASALGLADEPSVALPGVSRLGSRVVASEGMAGRFAFGVVNGLLPCGLVYAALGLSITAQGPASGALVMAAFGLGTAPLVTLFARSTSALGARHPRLHRTLTVGAGLLGLWVIARRGMLPLVH